MLATAADLALLESVRNLADARPAWEALGERSRSVFQTWEWASAWRRHLAPDAEVAVGISRHAEGTPFAVLPVYVAMRRPVRVLRLIGAGCSDELGPVCASEDRARADELLRLHVTRLLEDRGGVFLAERLPGDAARRIGGRTLRVNGSPIARLPEEGFDAFLTARSRNFRNQFRRYERRLLREHGLRYRMTERDEDLDRDLGTMIDLHERRWRGERSRAFSGPRRAFHHDFARQALARGWLRLWTMELDGRPVAAWYGLRYGNAYHYYQAARDPEYGRLKIGFVLLCHSIRSACEEGMEEYRFGLGDEPYKLRFTDADPGVETAGIGYKASGALAVASLLGGLEARDALRWVRSRLR